MLVSIIITNHNYGKYLARCLRSCLDQSLDKSDYEIIVVDDCSTDNSKLIIKKFLREKNIKFFFTKKNLGVAAAANLGIKKSKGKYFVRIDSDDYVSKDFCKFLYLYINSNSRLFCVSCNYYLVNENEEKIKEENANSNPISCGIMYSKSKFLKAGMYNSYFRHREEEEIRARLGDRYEKENLPIPLYRYRMHQTNKTKVADYNKLWKNRIRNIYLNKKNLNTDSNSKRLLKDIVAIIPARLNSKRLKNKNIRKIWGKPMIYWAINECKKSIYIRDVYVSSEDNKILEIAKKFNVKTIKRPKYLSGDKVFKIDVIRNAVRTIIPRRPQIIVIVQANSPDVSFVDIDRCIAKLINNNLNEVMSVDNQLNQNAAIRVVKYNSLFQESLSVHFGVVKTNIADIHLYKDLKSLENKSKKYYEN